jgi:hydrogenase nickel incorporation protein HypA/HybF
MHEVSIMQSALQTVERVARERNLAKVSRVSMRVGVLSGVVPDSLQFAFEVLCVNTVAAGAELDIEIVPAVFWCEACQSERRLTTLDFECDLCHGPLILKGGGHELEISSVEAEMD